MSTFSFSQKDDVTCKLQVNILDYSQTSKQKRKRSHVRLPAGVKPPVADNQRKEKMKAEKEKMIRLIRETLRLLSGSWTITGARAIII